MIKALVVDAWFNGLKSQSQIDEVLEFARDCGITDIYMQVRRRCDAYYNSQYEVKAPCIVANFDPLAYALENKGAIKIHAYITMLQVGNPAAFKQFPIPSSWIMQDEVKCAWIDPMNSEARVYLRNVVKDLITQYDVDGVFLEKLRYPGRNVGSGTLEERKDAIKSLIEDVSSDIREIKPSIPITLCVRGNGSTYQQNVNKDLVDWRELQSRNIIDKVTVMCFKESYSEPEFNAWVSLLDPEKEIMMIGSYRIPLITTALRMQATSGLDVAFYSYANFSVNSANTREDFKAILCQS